jgi:tetratricopeptide (TPR) repeat protein
MQLCELHPVFDLWGMLMYEQWKSMTVNQLLTEIERWKRRAEEQNREYENAFHADKNADLAEMNQEIVEKWMVIGMLKQMVAERLSEESKKRPSFPPTQRSITRQELAAHLDSAKAHIEERNAHLAIGELNISLHSYPRHAESLYYRGLAFAHLEKYQLAVEDFTAALQTQSNMREAYWERSRAYSRLRQYGPEIDDLTQVIRLSPYNVEAYRERGLAHYLIKQYQKALADLDRTLQLAADDESAYYFRAGVYMELGDYEQALEDCQLALKYRPDWLLPASRIKDIQKKISGS